MNKARQDNKAFTQQSEYDLAETAVLMTTHLFCLRTARSLNIMLWYLDVNLHSNGEGMEE